MNISHLCYLGNMQIETIFTDWSINETEPEILDIFIITFNIKDLYFYATPFRIRN